MKKNKNSLICIIGMLLLLVSYGRNDNIFKNRDAQNAGKKNFNVLEIELYKKTLSYYADITISIPPDSLNFDPFYKKYINAGGVPIISSEKVPNATILVARDIVNHMLMKRMDIRKEL